MNIFVLDTNPVTAAQQLCDQHVRKMIIESAQMLSAPFNRQIRYDLHPHGPYRACFLHHPCTKWVMQSRENFMWLAEHALQIEKEWRKLYNKPDHVNYRSIDIVNWCVHNIDKLHDRHELWSDPVPFTTQGLTPFATAMPDDCKVSDPVQSYHNYYLKYKVEFATWTNRPVPSWWRNNG